MVIRHWLLNGDAVDSVYLHIAPDKKGDGTPNTAGDLGSESDFSFREGDLVSKGDLIAVVGDVQPNPTHLHFEMRDSEIAGLPTAQDSAASQVYWPHSNSHKYYGSTQTPGTMTLDEVTNAYSRMQSDGIIDPSDFIDDHR